MTAVSKKRKSKTDADQLESRIKQLEREIEKERAARVKAENEALQASARLKAADLLFDQIRLVDLGIEPRWVFIEQIDQAGSKEEAEQILTALLDQDGCLGGRVLPPKEGGWRSQTFWPAEPAPRSTYLFEIFSAPLLPGQHYRMVPESLRRTAGFKPAAKA